MNGFEIAVLALLGGVWATGFTVWWEANTIRRILQHMDDEIEIDVGPKVERILRKKAER